MNATMNGAPNGSSRATAETFGRPVDSLADGLADPEPAQAGRNLLERVFAAASTKAVFGEPLTAGAYTIITASEVSAGGGFGSGGGFGPPALPVPPRARAPGADALPPQTPAMMGGGRGGGGGGAAGGRPIAVIIIGPQGVQVQPVVDVTKILLANVTLFAKLLPLLVKRFTHTQ